MLAWKSVTRGIVAACAAMVAVLFGAPPGNANQFGSLRHESDSSLSVDAHQAEATASGKSDSPMHAVHVIGLASERADKEGSLTVKLANGRTAKIPESLKSTVMARSARESREMSPDTVIVGNCGTSEVDLGVKENAHPVRMTTGFTVDVPALEYGWTVHITGPNYSYDYTASGLLAADSSWSGQHESGDDYTAGDYTATVTTGSYATLSDGTICYSGGPVADVALTSPDTPVEYVVPSSSNSNTESRETSAIKPHDVVDSVPITSVEDSTAYPNRTISRLDITWPNGDFTHCSGFMISPSSDNLATAGHCVFDPDRGGWAKLIFFLPATNPDSNPYGICQSKKYESSEGWVLNGDNNYDYAAIVGVCPYSTTTPGSIGLTAPASQNDAPPSPVTVTGYPGDINYGTQQYTSETPVPVESHDERRFTYYVDTHEGMSGAPVYTPCGDGSGTSCAVGIHTSTAADGEKAVRITQANFVNFSTWATKTP